MRKVFSVLLTAAVVFFAVWMLRPEWLPFTQVKADMDTIGAAQSICESLRQNPEERSFRFRSNQIDSAALFRALEASLPYAFSLSTITQQSGLMTVEVILENEAAQQQANVLARGLAENLAPTDMPLRERLRALHDQIVRACVYDTETAEHEKLHEGSGADAPFTAVGALIDGKAVCAGYARAYMQLCDAAGIDVLYITDEGMNHGWNAVRVYDEVLYVDVTYDDPVPDRGKLVSTEFFLIDAGMLSKTHRWDQAFYNDLIEQLLPPQLGDAQRLFDLGMLPVPPRAVDIAKPLTQEARTMLQEKCGIPFTAADETLGGAAARIWGTLTEEGGARRLIDAGVFDEVRARQVGIPESAVQKRKD